MRRILIASGERDSVETIQKSFDPNDSFNFAPDRVTCFQYFRKKRYEFLFIDIDFLDNGSTDRDYKEQLQPFWAAFPSTEIIILADSSRIRQAVRAVRSGASDYLTYPVDRAEVRLVIENIGKNQKLFAELQTLRNQFWRKDFQAVLRTQSPLMKAVFDKVRSVAQTDSTVLLTGETGTGKGVVANLIHRHSRRSEKQFIAVHCGAIPDTLLESELFGHEKGAFTGATRLKPGKFEIADGGTLFLDEIGTISPSMQVKLLQILQDKSYQRVGGDTTLTSDVRIIAATNADLETMCENGTFRRDLYYRLLVFPIEIPPLRDRREDIPILVEGFMEKMNRFSTKKVKGIAPEIITMLQQYHWPGNIRELENVIERAHVLESSKALTAQNFPTEIVNRETRTQTISVDPHHTLDTVRKTVVEKAEREYLCRLLELHNGRIDSTAEAAGIGVRQLHKLMTKYHLHKENFKKIRSIPL